MWSSMMSMLESAGNALSSYLEIWISKILPSMHTMVASYGAKILFPM